MYFGIGRAHPAHAAFEVELLGKLSSTVVASELETVVASEVGTAAVVECTANGGSGG